MECVRVKLEHLIRNIVQRHLAGLPGLLNLEKMHEHGNVEPYVEEWALENALKRDVSFFSG